MRPHMRALQLRIDRLRAALPPGNTWGTAAERAAMSAAIAAHCAGQTPPADALQTLGMTAGEFADMLARVEASC